MGTVFWVLVALAIVASGMFLKSWLRRSGVQAKAENIVTNIRNDVNR